MFSPSELLNEKVNADRACFFENGEVATEAVTHALQEPPEIIERHIAFG